EIGPGRRQARRSAHAFRRSSRTCRRRRNSPRPASCRGRERRDASRHGRRARPIHSRYRGIFRPARAAACGRSCPTCRAAPSPGRCSNPRHGGDSPARRRSSRHAGPPRELPGSPVAAYDPPLPPGAPSAHKVGPRAHGLVEGGVLSRLVAPQVVGLYAFAASALAIHYCGRVPLGFGRQLTDHSTIMAPYNVLMYAFSAVPNKPMLPVSAVPELAKLRENWQAIRDEATALFDEGRIKAADGYNDWGFNSFFRSGWKRFYLKWYDDSLPSAKRMCPRTVALLESIPCIKGAMFATLSPGARLVQHRDPFAGSLRYHLGLVTPTHPGECRILVDGIPYSWREGE